MSKLISINPSNKKILGSVETSSEKEIKNKIGKAQGTKLEWKELEIGGRVKILRDVVKGFLNKKEEVAKLASSEMGMPINLSRADVADSINYFNWYLDNAEKYLGPEVVFENDKIIHTVLHEPIGVSANIVPWNFPTSNFVWSVAQSLVSGNVVIFKSSEEVPLSGKLIEKIFMESNLPDGVFSEVYGASDVRKDLVGGNIDLICFTGSSKVGNYLYKVAAEKFIKVLLELGGSAPGIVCEDADIDRVIDTIFANRFLYSGQVCDGLKRLIVHKDIFDKIVDKLTEKIGKVRVDDALDEKTEIGPLVSEKQLLTLESQVEQTKSQGAKVVVGGTRIEDLSGFFYEPTILTNIKPEMKVWNEEVFGPVLPIATFDNEEEAIKIANDTDYGLGSYIYTEDKKKARRVAEQIQTGMVSVNNASYLQPCSPFGECKRSGIGREHGKFGFNELTQVKVIAEEK